MTISTTDNREQYTGNDSTTVFPYGFYIGANSELSVTLTDTVAGTDTPLVLDTDYSVSGATNPAGGNVTYPISGSPLTSTERLTILRVTPLTQATDLPNQGPFFGNTVEEMVDKLTRIAQDHEERLDRTPAADVTATSPTLTVVTSAFGRIGDVVATAGDYTAALVTNAFDKTADTSDDISEGSTNKFASAANVLAAGAVMTTGAQAVAGVKTFSSSPVVPTPSSATDAANKNYVDGVVRGSFANTIETAIDVNPATPYNHYLVDASTGHRTITLPNATLGAGQWFSVTLVSDGNHCEITTVGGTQTFGSTGLTSIGVFTVDATLILSTNAAGDGYDVVMDTRTYHRVIETTTDLDLSTGGFESGAVYLIKPAVGATATITLAAPESTHIGTWAKFVLAEGAGGYGNAIIQEATTGLDEEIVTPEKGFELMDDGTSYRIVQDSRGGSQTLALFQYFTDTVSPTVGTYRKSVANTSDADYDTVAVDFTTGAVTGTSQLIEEWLSDPGAVVGEISESTSTWNANFRKTAGSTNATFYIEVYKRAGGGTETLLGTSNITAAVSSGTYVGVDTQTLISGTTFASADMVLVKLYANKVGSGTDPTYDIQLGGSDPSRVVFSVPASALPHDSLADIKAASDAGVTNGHITSEQYDQIIAPNLLINADGTNPLDQGGSLPATSLANGSYMSDRWYVGHDATPTYVSTSEESDGGIRLTAETGFDGSYIESYQLIESPEKYRGKTVTLSCRMRSNTSGASIRIFNGSGFSSTVPHTGSGDFETLQLTYEIPVGATALRPGFVITPATAGDYIEFEWIKLEVGSVATPFVADKDRGTTLRECLPYHERINAIGAYAQFGHGHAYSTTECNIMIDHCRKRSNTWTVGSGGNLQLSNNVATYAVTGLSLAYRADGKTTLAVSVASGLTAGDVYTLTAANDTTAYLEFLDEL